jgi:hypothetical protein
MPPFRWNSPHRTAVAARALVPALLFSLACLPQHLTAATGSEHRKVEVRDEAAARRVQAAGGTLVADYGSYQLFDVPRWAQNQPVSAELEPRDDYSQVFLNTRTLDTRRPEIQALRRSAAPQTGRHARLVQFAGPVLPPWREALTNTGARILSYVPQNAYLIYVDAPGLARLQGLASNVAFIQWEAPLAQADKVHPSARPIDAAGRARTAGAAWFTVQLADDAEPNAATLALLSAYKLEPFRRSERRLGFLNLEARLPASVLDAIAARPDVVSIHPRFEPRLFCERQAQIVAGNLNASVPVGSGYLSWLAGIGFTQAQFDASGFLVDVSDSGIDNGTVQPNHFGLFTQGILTASSRVGYARLEGTANTGSTLSGCDGHGTLNAHIIAGYADLSGFPFADSSGYHYGLGICPFVRVGSSTIFDPDTFTDPSLSTLQSHAYQSGARISNNSWGADTAGDYTVYDQTYDALVRDAQSAVAGNQEMVIVFAAGNAGPDAGSVGSPGCAKNVITVGAAENVQPFGGSDGSGISDTQANSANDMASFSSRGPCADGRHKPDLVAPGTHVSGGVAQAASPVATGTADSCFTGSGVSGGVDTSFFPAGQQFYTASSGTSHAAPCVSGGCALLRQYFINQGTNPPSPAMTKAFLLNSARYLNGTYAKDTLWSDSQGMGEMNLGMAFDGARRILRDQLPADVFTASGQTRSFAGGIADPTKPFRVTLAWTDAPGNTVGPAYNNNLDLLVTVNGVTYKGNVFNGACSTNGGSADAANNVESVFLPVDTSGSFVVRVLGTSINSVGVPNSSNALCQDFALVIYNGTNALLPAMTPAGATVSAEHYYPTNGVLDPGEIATLNLGVANIGTTATTNLTATLLASNNLAVLSGTQSYGAVPASGAAVVRPFVVSASGGCGDSVTAVLQLSDGPADLGAISYTLRLGQRLTTTNLAETFDTATPPILPSGWTTATEALGSNWITSTNLSDTMPNAAHGPESDGRGVAELISPAFQVTSPSNQLVFRHSYDFEAYGSTNAFDGGVLEIQIGAGDFTDILSAGGSFDSGGYVREISTGSDYDNYLGGRTAWTASSGGFITTVANLPASANGQTARAKWRLATDSGNGYGGNGWYLDSVTVIDPINHCETSLISPAALQSLRTAGQSVLSFSTVAGQPYTIEYTTNLAGAYWLPLQSVTGTGGLLRITNSSADPRRFYRVKTP